MDGTIKAHSDRRELWEEKKEEIELGAYSGERLIRQCNTASHKERK
jgi:hypothetical protein